MGAVLRCIECPEIGGDTIWVNMVDGLRAACPMTSRRRSPNLRAKASIEHSFGAVMPDEQRPKLGAQNPPVEHPVVRTHPETGEKILYVGSFTTHFVNYQLPENVRYGIDKTPGAGAAAELPDQPGHHPRIPGALVRGSRAAWPIWDNRCTQHYAVNDYWPAPRKMERAGIVGDIPY